MLGPFVVYYRSVGKIKIENPTSGHLLQVSPPLLERTRLLHALRILQIISFDEWCCE
jgi:hypothetical protein